MNKRVRIEALWASLVVVTFLFFSQRWLVRDEGGTSSSAVHLISGEAVCPVDTLPVGIPRSKAVIGS